MRVLACRIERVFVCRAVELADRGARLHRVRHEPVVDQVELDDLGSLGDRGIGRRHVSQMPVVAQIAGRLLRPHLRRTGFQRLVGIDDGRFDCVVEIDVLGRVAGLSQTLANDDRDRIADMAHPSLREHRVRRLLHRRAVLRIHEPAAWQAPDARGFEILAGEDRDHPGGRSRGARIDAVDPRIGVRAAQNKGVELTRPVDVVGIGSLSGQEPIILAPPDRLPDCRHLLYSAAAAPCSGAGGASPRIIAAPAMIASTML
jgi:hypothetical protein